MLVWPLGRLKYRCPINQLNDFMPGQWPTRNPHSVIKKEKVSIRVYVCINKMSTYYLKKSPYLISYILCTHALLLFCTIGFKEETHFTSFSVSLSPHKSSSSSEALSDLPRTLLTPPPYPQTPHLLALQPDRTQTRKTKMSRSALQILAACWLASYIKGDNDLHHEPATRSLRAKKHVFMDNMPELSSRSDLIKRSALSKDHVHELVFVVQQLNMDELTKILHDVSDPSSPNYGHHMSGEQVNSMTMNPIARDAIVAYLHSNGAIVKSETMNSEYITAHAPLSVWETVLDTEFYKFHQEQLDGQIEEHVRAEKYSVPSELYEHLDCVFNTIEMPVRFTKSVIYPVTGPEDSSHFSETVNYFGYVTPTVIRGYYNLTDNHGSENSTQSIFGGRLDYLNTDDLSLFQSLDDVYIRQPALNINGHLVTDRSQMPSGADFGEGNLDTQYIIAMSYGSPTTYWSWQVSLAGWLISVSNTIDPPLVLSISYGSNEKYISPAELRVFSTMAIKLGARGVTIVVASGDDGAVNFESRGGVLSKCGYFPVFPASNPYVLSVGATEVRTLTITLTLTLTLTLTPTLIVFFSLLHEPYRFHLTLFLSSSSSSLLQGGERLIKEVVCSANTTGRISSGGGFSTIYGQPSWQKSAVSDYFSTAAAAGLSPVPGYNRSGRAYPDVSLMGLNYLVMYGGGWVGMAGTSASCPVMAGLISNINAARMALGKGSVGWVTPALYGNAAAFVNDIVSGNNKCSASAPCCTQGYDAVPGWDPASGLGSVNYGKMQDLFVSLGDVGAMTPNPTSTPTLAPTPNPTAKPTSPPTLIPTATPAPTIASSSSPLNRRTAKPTKRPLGKPSRRPTAAKANAEESTTIVSATATPTPAVISTIAITQVGFNHLTSLPLPCHAPYTPPVYTLLRLSILSFYLLGNFRFFMSSPFTTSHNQHHEHNQTLSSLPFLPSLRYRPSLACH